MLKKIFSILIITIIAFSVSSCEMKENNGPTENGVIPPVTKIANEFAGQLPEFKFSEKLIESYDESLSYSFSVECSEKESEKYIKAVKNEGFTEGYPDAAPISGKGYYKASNAEGYMAEIVYKNGVLTVYVTRP